MEFSRQEPWSGSPFPPGALPDPGIKPGLLHFRKILYCLYHQGSPSLGYCQKRPQTGCFKQQMLISHSSRGWESETKFLTDLAPVEGSCVLARYIERELSGIFSCKDTNPVVSGIHPDDLINYFFAPNTAMLGVRPSTY